MIRASALLLVAAFAISASPAVACSFIWKPGHSPDEIKARADMRLIKGVFHYERARGEVGEDGTLQRGTIEGRLETEGGKNWQTVQPFDQFMVECAAYLRPTADARGKFWIERRRKNGRYELYLWEGEYLPDPKCQTTEEHDEKAATH